MVLVVFSKGGNEVVGEFFGVVFCVLEGVKGCRLRVLDVEVLVGFDLDDFVLVLIDGDDVVVI